MQVPLIKIAIDGPESTGKSTLSSFLARTFQTSFVPEYSRVYLAGTGGHYGPEDVVKIAKLQHEKEFELTKSCNGLLFCDTTALVTKVWYEYKYGKSHPEIEQLFSDTSYDLRLLCEVDLPWEPDPLREHPDQREELSAIYKTTLARYGKSYQLITGIEKEREQLALEIVTSFLKSRSFPVKALTNE